MKAIITYVRNGREYTKIVPFPILVTVANKIANTDIEMNLITIIDIQNNGYSGMK